MSQPPPTSASTQNIYLASYAAFFAPRTHKFETIDFRVPASPANLASYFPTSSKDATRRRRLAGLLGLLIGVVFGIIGFLVDQFLRGLTIGLYTVTARLLTHVGYWLAVVVFIAISLLYTLIPACLVIYVAPLGAGSGIPELKSYLNGVKIPGFLATNSFLVKVVGICFSKASGLLCGKQGPMIHAGAIVGAGISQAASARFGWRWNHPMFRFLRTEAWKRDFSAVGAAVGVAVAFGSPMGAWMWVYEEACTHWTWDLGIITLGGCLAGTVVMRILNFLAMGMPGGFPIFSLTMFGKLVTPFDAAVFPLKDIPAFVLIGVFGGVAGALLPALNRGITLFRYKSVTRPVPRILEVLLVTFLTALLRIGIPRLANDCRSVNKELVEVLTIAPLGDYSRFHCPEGEYSPWASVMYNPTDSVVRGLLFVSGKDTFPALGAGISLIYYFVFIVWTYGVAVPAGVFFPCVLLGTVYGRLTGIAVQAIFEGRTDVSLTGYALVGAVSALAGSTRTISVAVIVLEATGATNASFGAVLVAIIAKLVGDFLYSKGIYDLHIALKGIPFLSAQVPRVEVYSKLRVGELMETNVIGVRRLSRVSGLLRMLSTNDHHAFPVFVKVAKGRRRMRGSTTTEQELMAMVPEDEEEDDNQSGSETSLMELELKDESGEMALKTASKIITPCQFGMQVTIFDDGVARVAHLMERGEAHTFSSVPRVSSSNDMWERRTSGDSTEREMADFELMGTINRRTLLAVLKHECDVKEGKCAESELRREELDDAWPNVAVLKGDGEKQLGERVRRLGLDKKVVDLKIYTDTDPLLMSDCAKLMAAYKLFGGTGARHILVTNMRSGRVCGIMTRKDVLAESVDEVLKKMNGVKMV